MFWYTHPRGPKVRKRYSGSLNRCHTLSGGVGKKVNWLAKRSAGTISKVLQTAARSASNAALPIGSSLICRSCSWRVAN